MSAFKPQTLPPIESATGLAAYILQSRQDFIPISRRTLTSLYRHLF